MKLAQPVNSASLSTMAAPPRVQLGASDLRVHPLGLGCMGMSAYYPPFPSKEECIPVIHRALQLGCNFFDTSDSYGNGANEELLGEAIKKANVNRSDLIIATKFGLQIQPDGTMGVNGKPEYVRKCCEASLKRLGMDYIDLYYQHRVDPSTPIEDTVKEMAQLIKDGKVRYLGLSECSVANLRRAHAVHPITAVQVEYSLWSTHIEEDGILNTCRELGITVVAYSPLARGFLGGQIKKYEDLDETDLRRNQPRFQPENFSKNLELLAVIEALAKGKNCTSSQVALAWVISQQGVVAIPGTKKISYLEENYGAMKVQITELEIKNIRGFLSQFVIAGDRNTTSSLNMIANQ